ncbi:MAG: hypothetical protein WDW38_007637 [Sanguina aurantia]
MELPPDALTLSDLSIPHSTAASTPAPQLELRMSAHAGDAMLLHARGNQPQTTSPTGSAPREQDAACAGQA